MRDAHAVGGGRQGDCTPVTSLARGCAAGDPARSIAVAAIASHDCHQRPSTCGGARNSPCASPNSRSRRVAVREDISRELRTASGRADGAAPLVTVNRAAERRAWNAMLERMVAIRLIGVLKGL